MKSLSPSNTHRKSNSTSRFSVDSIMSEIHQRIGFNDISMKYRYEQMKLSQMYNEQHDNVPQKNNLFEKLKHKGHAFDSDILLRKDVKIEPPKKKKIEINRVNSVQDIKRASELFNEYIDKIAMNSKKKNFLPAIINEEDNDNDISDFINGINEEFINTERVNNMDKKPKRNLFKGKSKLLTESANVLPSRNTKKKKKTYRTLQLDLKVNPDMKGECVFSERHSFSNTTRSTKPKQKMKSELSPVFRLNQKILTRNQLSNKTLMNKMNSFVFKGEENLNINPDLKKSKEEYKKLLKIKKENRKMAQYYLDSIDNEYTYNMKMTSAKIDFLQNNISKMLHQTALTFSKRVDHIQNKCSFLKLKK